MVELSAGVAVIVDIVESRRISDRPRVQHDIEKAFELVNTRVPTRQPLRATVGDEFQASYAQLDHALIATLLARLAVPPGVDLRFGLGHGGMTHVGMGLPGPLQDGPAWWRAREAIDEAHRRADTRSPSCRSWYHEASPSSGTEPIVNAYLLARDQIIGAMSDRARRLTWGLAIGRPQSALALDEGITQSAVSQSLRRSGGSSLITGLGVFSGEAP